MLHLDIKPKNIMLDKNNKPYLIDFGLSKQYDENGEPETSTSIGLGTPGYAPTEQASYKQDGTFPATLDVYALGATLYKMLTGNTPPDASYVLNNGLPALPNEVSKKVSDAITKAMQPRKAERFQSVSEFLSSLSGESHDEETLTTGNKNDEDKTITGTSHVNEKWSKTISDNEPAANIKVKPYVFWMTAGILAAIIMGILLFTKGGNQGYSQEEDITEIEASNLPPVIQNLIDNMVRVDGGTFTMGATSEQGSNAAGDEKPAHQVNLSSFSIGKYEVSQEEWEAVMGSNPSYFKGAKRPVEKVSWNDCQAFIRKLNELTGRSFRLPTEAEWEYAARGGNKSIGDKYAGGDNLGSVAWYEDNSGGTTHNVGTKSPNELGLYDMSGNVWEWCQDWYDSYSSSAQTNPKGATAVCLTGATARPASPTTTSAFALPFSSALPFKFIRKNRVYLPSTAMR